MGRKMKPLRASISPTGKGRISRTRVRLPFLVFFVIMVLEAGIAYIDRAFGRTIPAGYFYILPVILGGLYLGYPGGIGVPVLSIGLFHVVEKTLPHRVYAEADFLWLILLIVLGTVTAQTQADRRRAREHSRQLEQLNRAREELTALIVHDLRTPLAGVLNVLRLIAEESPSGLLPEHAQLLDIALATGEDMTGMIGDLLNLHAMESGRLELHEEEVKPAEVVSAATRQVEPLARQRGVKIQTRTAEGLPAFRADEVMIRRVLVNLLGNALRFSPREAAIMVEARRAGAEIEFSVADKGPGISAHLKEKIFEKFAGLDEEAGKHVSTGLGLAFAKMAVEAHGGRIWVESPWTAPSTGGPPQGSRFSFTLPLSRRP